MKAIISATLLTFIILSSCNSKKNDGLVGPIEPPSPEKTVTPTPTPTQPPAPVVNSMQNSGAERMDEEVSGLSDQIVGKTLHRTIINNYSTIIFFRNSDGRLQRRKLLCEDSVEIIELHARAAPVLAIKPGTRLWYKNEINQFQNQQKDGSENSEYVRITCISKHKQ